jgi:hypothetical protein
VKDPYDGSGPLDPNCDAVIANRSRYGKVLWLFGDSIYRGTALRKYSDRYTRAEIEVEPLWPFRAPCSMINLAFADSGLLNDGDFDIIREAEFIACFAGDVGQPGPLEKTLARIRSLQNSRAIRASDAMVFLNAGPHTSDPDLYEAQWIELRKLATAVSGVTMYICDTFDNLTKQMGRKKGDQPVESFMYEVPWTSPSGRSRTHNQATRDAVAFPLETPGRTELLELATVIKDWHAESLATTGVPIYMADGIHLNVWGQMRLAGRHLRAICPEVRVTSLRRTHSLVATQWAQLGYGTQSPRWTEEAAHSYVDRCYEIS